MKKLLILLFLISVGCKSIEERITCYTDKGYYYSGEKYQVYCTDGKNPKYYIVVIDGVNLKRKYIDFDKTINW